MNLPRLLASAGVAALVLVTAACGDDSEEGGIEGGEGAAFTTPAHGDEVTSPFTVGMTAEGVNIVAVDDAEPDDGHFHVIVDEGCVDVGDPIPPTEEDPAYLHFGDGSTDAEIDLEPGDHDLCLQVGNQAHIAQDMTHEISITVTE
jgi:hypothetical protein